MGGMRDVFTLINLGTLDGLLLKPIDSQFYIASRRIRLLYVVRLVLGIGICIFIANNKDLHMTPGSIIYGSVLLIIGALCLFPLIFSIATLAIKYPRLDGLIDMTYSFRNAMQYTPEMFQKFHPATFVLLLPYLLIASIPTKALLGKSTLIDTITLCGMTVGALLFSRLLWNYALRHYTSASS
jgi:ABC-2 type transport system permease protein